MQPIKNIYNHLNNKKKFLFLLIVIFFLFNVFFIFFLRKKASVFTPPQLSSSLTSSTIDSIDNTLVSLTSPSLDKIKESFTQIPVYIGNQPDFPSALPSLKITANNNQTFISQLNSLCQINNNQEDFFYGNLCNYYYFDQNNYVSLNRSAEQLFAEDEFTSVDINKTQIEASNFFNKIIPDFFQNYILTDIECYEGIGEYVTTDASENAQLVEFKYDLAYQNIPIFTKESVQHNLSILSSSKNLLQKGIFPTKNFLITARNDSFNLITLDQALKNISLNHGYLLQIGPLNESSDYLSNSPTFTEIVFDKVILEYRYDKNYQLAIPSYHFFGKGLDLNGNSLIIEIITPAIEIK